MNFVRQKAVTCTTLKYKGQSVSFRAEYFALVQSVVTTPAFRGIIPKVS
jgi:hypothetical protein